MSKDTCDGSGNQVVFGPSVYEGVVCRWIKRPDGTGFTEVATPKGWRPAGTDGVPDMTLGDVGRGFSAPDEMISRALAGRPLNVS